MNNMLVIIAYLRINASPYMIIPKFKLFDFYTLQNKSYLFHLEVVPLISEAHFDLRSPYVAIATDDRLW
jgi:hypothetical protein